MGDGSHQHRPRVVIVDSDRRVRQSLSDVLRLSGSVEVLGSAGDARTGLELVALTHPSVVIVDPRLPELSDGAALLKGLRLGWPSLQVVLMGWSDSFDEQLDLGLQASAVVHKGAQPEAFVNAVLNACGCGPSQPTSAT